MKRIILASLSLLMAGTAMAQQVTVQAVSDASMENPHDIKLTPDGRFLLVSDVGNDRVLVLDPETLAAKGSFGEQDQDGTHDVDFDATGRAYVADTHNNQVLIYTMDGATARQSGRIVGDFRGPEGVLNHPSGLVYVAGAWSHNVIAYRDGEPVHRLDGLASPHDLELDPGGDIWLADAGNDRLLRLSTDLTVQEELSGPAYGFRGVRYMDLLADGTIIAADKNNDRVVVIAPDRSVQLVIGTGDPGGGTIDLTTPEGVEVRGDTLWISDSGNDRIIRYRFDFGG